MDSNRATNLGFPIPAGSMGIFIGMSAMHFLKGEKWGIEVLIDFDSKRRKKMD